MRIKVKNVKEATRLPYAQNPYKKYLKFISYE